MPSSSANTAQCHGWPQRGLPPRPSLLFSGHCPWKSLQDRSGGVGSRTRGEGCRNRLRHTSARRLSGETAAPPDTDFRGKHVTLIPGPTYGYGRPNRTPALLVARGPPSSTVNPACRQHLLAHKTQGCWAQRSLESLGTFLSGLPNLSLLSRELMWPVHVSQTWWQVR